MTEASCRKPWYAYREAGTGMQLQSTLTCPKCSYQAVEAMPTDACQFFYDCKGCGERLKPLAGDCCVFCSYGSVPCPPIQSNMRCCVPAGSYSFASARWQNRRSRRRNDPPAT